MNLANKLATHTRALFCKFFSVLVSNLVDRRVENILLCHVMFDPKLNRSIIDTNYIKLTNTPSS